MTTITHRAMIIATRETVERLIDQLAKSKGSNLDKVEATLVAGALMMAAKDLLMVTYDDKAFVQQHIHALAEVDAPPAPGTPTI